MTLAPRVAAGPHATNDGTTPSWLSIDNIPAGTLDVIVRTGKAAGEVVIQPLPAPIGRIFVQTESAGDENNLVTITADEVALRVIQWDIDGHTDYPGMPKAVFLDLAGVTTGRILLDVQGEDELHVDTNGRAYFKGFQFKLVDWTSWKPGQMPFELHAAGCLYLLDDKMDIRMPGLVAGHGGQWYTVAKARDWRCGEPGG